MPVQQNSSFPSDEKEAKKAERMRDITRTGEALAASEVVSRFGSANAEFIKGYSGIDNDTVRDLAALVREWNLEGRTIISVLHDYEHVRQEYRQALLLAGEVIAFGDPAEILNEQYLQNARELITTRHEAKTVAVCNQESGL